MIYQPYVQYTKGWTKVRERGGIPNERMTWIQNHEGGMYYYGFDGLKFERKEDAEWYMLRWL